MWGLILNYCKNPFAVIIRIPSKTIYLGTLFLFLPDGRRMVTFFFPGNGRGLKGNLLVFVKKNTWHPLDMLEPLKPQEGYKLYLGFTVTHQVAVESQGSVRDSRS